MPGRGTERHAVRMPDELWQRLGEAAAAAGADRSAVIRDLVRWYLRDPGVVLPQRPPG